MAKSAKDLLPISSVPPAKPSESRAEELKDKRVAVRITPSLYRDFVAITKKQEKQMSTVLTRLMQDYVNQYKDLL